MQNINKKFMQKRTNFYWGGSRWKYQALEVQVTSKSIFVIISAGQALSLSFSLSPPLSASLSLSTSSLEAILFCVWLLNILWSRTSISHFLVECSHLKVIFSHPFPSPGLYCNEEKPEKLFNSWWKCVSVRELKPLASLGKDQGVTLGDFMSRFFPSGTSYGC